eukprot:TRINITY_DN2265_c0_g1_i1.p1 TRINITY_DN2265_c0_g1~~TRINITY_DN2265_c0_g1_i1.p1  ORF type:complete len:2128 (-),score=551.89 TRINITY_DN2265_c0_g1_i1:181-6564(-)
MYKTTFSWTNVPRVRCWGKGDNGQNGMYNATYGDGSDPNFDMSNVYDLTFRQATRAPFTEISCGGRHCCGLHEKGAMFDWWDIDYKIRMKCWGDGFYGQRGLNSLDTTGQDFGSNFAQETQNIKLQTDGMLNANRFIIWPPNVPANQGGLNFMMHGPMQMVGNFYRLAGDDPGVMSDRRNALLLRFQGDLSGTVIEKNCTNKPTLYHARCALPTFPDPPFLEKQERWTVSIGADRDSQGLPAGHHWFTSAEMYLMVNRNDSVVDYAPKSSPITNDSPATVIDVGMAVTPSDRYRLRFTNHATGNITYHTCLGLPELLGGNNYLACELPVITTSLLGDIAIRFGENARNHWWDVGQYRFYDIYPTSVTPWGASVTGGTILNLTIANFVQNTSAIMVRFQLDQSSPSVKIDTEIQGFMDSNAGIQVVVPDFQPVASQFQLEATFKIFVSWDGGDNYMKEAGKYQTITIFGITSVIALVPAAAPVGSNQNVTITGSGFFDPPPAQKDKLVVRFDFPGLTRVDVQGTYDATSNAVLAPIPALAVGAVGTVELTFNAQQYTNSKVVFSMFDIASIFPLGGPAVGGTEVTVAGSGFQFSGENLKCKFGNQTVIATYISKTRILCDTPPSNSSSAVTAQITVNGKDWSGGGTNFQFLPPISVSSISPDRGPSSSYTNITVSGTGFFYIPNGAGCRIGVVTGTATIISGKLICLAPPGLGSLNVWVTVNGQDYIDSDKKFVFYDLFRLEPPLGPTEGGTSVLISGTGFLTTGSTTKCKFGTVIVSATLSTSAQLRCEAPPQGVSYVPVELTIDSGTTWTQNGQLYRYYETPTVKSLFPKSGGSAGGTVVTIKGDNYIPVAAGYVKCKFGLSASDGTVSADNSTVVCPSPPGFGIVDVFVSLNGGIHYTTSSATFSYAAIVRLVPSTGPVSGGTTVSVTGSGFLSEYKDQIRCKFGSSYIIQATVIDEVQLTCVSPPGSTSTQIVISTNNVDWAHVPLTFEYYNIPVITSFTPTHGSPKGGTRVLVTGSGFIDTPELRCKIGDKVIGEKDGERSFFSPTLISCISPSNTGLSPLAVSLNKQDFHVAAQGFSYFTLLSITPDQGPIEGGTRVTITGEGFDPPDLSSLKCRMNGRVIPAEQLHAASIICTMPLFDEVNVNGRLRTEELHTKAIATSRGFVDIEVTANDKEYVGSASGFGTFEYYDQPIITAMTPDTGSASGDDHVTLYGSKFPFTTKLSCKFGEEYDVVATMATWLSATHISCKTTPHPEGPNHALVSVNGVDYAVSENTALYTFKDCDPGHYAKVHTDPCQKCPPGTAQPDYRGKSCDKCDRYSYAPNEGTKKCTACPANTIINAVERNDIMLCECQEGTFNRQALRGIDCEECPEGGVCPGGIEPPVPAPQWWNSDADPFVFLQCVNPEQCPGGLKSACAEGYEGRLCAQCTPGWYARGNYCEKCPKAAFWTLIVFGLFVLLLILGLMRAVGKNASAYGGTINIATFFFQVVGIIAKLKLKWPKSVGTTMNLMSSPFSLNLDILASECSIPLVSYQTKWVFKITMPILFLILFSLLYLIQVCIFAATAKKGNLVEKEKRRKDLNTLKNSLVDGFMLLLALAYLLLITTSFEIFDCTPGKDGASTLDAKPDLNCYENWWWQLMPIGAAGILIYGIMIPGSMFIIIYRNRKNVSDPLFIESFGSVIIEYTPQRPYWEAVIMLEKLLIAGTLIFFTTFENVQIIAFLLVLMLGLAANVLAQPYFIQRYNRLQILLRWSSALMLLAGMLFRASDFPGKAAELIVTAVVFLILGASAALVFGAIGYDVYVIRRTLSKTIDESTLEKVSELCHPQGKTLLMEWLGARTSDETDQVIKYIVTLLFYRRHHDLTAKVDYGKEATASDRLVNDWTGRIFLEPVVPTVRAWLVDKINEAREGDSEAQLDIRRFHGVFADFQRFIMYGDGDEIFNDTEVLRDVIIPDQEEAFAKISEMIEEDRLRARESEQALLAKTDMGPSLSEDSMSQEGQEQEHPDNVGLFQSFGLANLQSLAAFGGGGGFLDTFVGTKGQQAAEDGLDGSIADGLDVGGDGEPAPEPPKVETMADHLGPLDFDEGSLEDLGGVGSNFDAGDFGDDLPDNNNAEGTMDDGASLE